MRAIATRAVLILGLTGCASGLAAEPMQEVTIGFAAPVTAIRVASGVQAAQLAIAEANKRALHLDDQRLLFTLSVQDDKGDPRFAPAVARYLIRSGVVGVVGHWNSGASLATSKLYAEAGIAQLPPATVSRKFTQDGLRTTFQVLGNDSKGALHLADFVVHDLEAKRIAVIEDGTQFGTDFMDRFVEGLAAHSGNLVSRERISSKTSDFNQALIKVRKLNADVIVFGGIVNQSAELANSMARLGIKAKLVSTGGTATALFRQLAKEVSNDVWSLEPGVPKERLPGWKAFQAQMRKQYDGEITHYAVYAYDATNLLIAAIQKANSLNPQMIVNALHGMKYNGLTGTISFDENGNLLNPSYSIYRLEDGKWSPAKVFEDK